MAAAKDVVRRHLLEAITLKRPELWNELMSESFVLHHPLVAPGRDAYVAAVESLWAAFPDLRVEVLDLVAEDDKVVARYIERGTHRGEFLGLAPTGRAYEKHGFTLYRVERSVLAEAWLQEDDLSYQAQVFGT